MPSLLKQRLAENRVLRVFTVGRLFHPVVIEMFGMAGGYDGFWLDQEHVGLTCDQITMAAIAARANNFGCFTRIPTTHYSLVAQNLESGVDGVMAARVMGAADAEEFVRWCLFAPRGWRGMNTSGFDGKYTGKTLSQLAGETNPNVFIAIQIETKSALIRPRQLRRSMASIYCSSARPICRQSWGRLASLAMRKCWKPAGTSTRRVENTAKCGARLRLIQPSATAVLR